MENVFCVNVRSAPKEEIISRLSDLFSMNTDYIIVVGDMNWDYLDQNNAIKDFFQQNDFFQMISTPTHEEGGILDHVYVKGDQCEEKFFVCQKSRYYSDHDAIFIKINGD